MRTILAVVAFLTPSSLILAQAIQRPDAVKTQVTPSAPDLAGVWKRSARPPDHARRYTKFELTLALPTRAGSPQQTPWGEAKFKANKPNVGPNPVPIKESNDPDLNKLSAGVLRIYLERAEPFGNHSVPRSRGSGLRIQPFGPGNLYAMGRKHSEDLVSTWMGDSIGKWEGNTLVVDTIGFNDQTWLDYSGHPHSDALHVVERFQRVDHDDFRSSISRSKIRKRIRSPGEAGSFSI